MEYRSYSGEITSYDQNYHYNKDGNLNNSWKSNIKNALNTAIFKSTYVTSDAKQKGLLQIVRLIVKI